MAEVKEEARIIWQGGEAEPCREILNLLQEHYRIEAASSPDEVLKAAQQNLPDLILAEVELPQRNSKALLEALRSHAGTSALPVILFSLSSDSEQKVEALESGADDFLVMPFTAREVLATVRAHLNLAEVRKKTEAELRDTRTRLEIALTAGEIGTWTWDVLLDRVAADKNLARFFSVSPKDASGGPISVYLQAIHPEDRNRVIQSISTVLEKGEAYEAEYRLLTDTGLPRWVIARGRIERDAQGKAISVPGVVLDITARKKAEQSYQVTEQALALAVNGAELGTFYCNVPFDKIIWNDTCKQHFYLPPDAEVDFELFYSLLHADDRERTRLAVEKCMRDRVQYNVEYRVVGPQGQLRWINAIGKGYYTEEGNPYRFDGITIDITEKKQRERVLNFLVQINDAARPLADPEMVMETISRMLGEFMEVSRCAYAPVEADENHFTIYRDYTNGCSSSAGNYELTDFGPRIATQLRQGQTLVIQNRAREATPDDPLEALQKIGIQATIATALIKEGRLAALMAVHQSRPRSWLPEEIQLVEMVAERSWDIIERARAGKHLVERAEEIEVLNHRLRRAMIETHHRVKNNLQVMSSLIELQGQNEVVSKEELLRLKQNIQALGVIHDILTREVKTGEEYEFLSIKEVLDRFLPIVQATLGQRPLLAKIEEIHLPGKHATSLAIVANELISNAVKHGKGAIELTLHSDGLKAFLEVCDDGPGFKEGFHPEHSANTGLELIENIARYDLRGNTRYLNREEGGARIIVAFPLTPRASQEKERTIDGER